MNEIRRPVREADEIEAINSIVGQHKHVFPEFVTAFRAELGHFNDSPAVWITFLLREDLPPGHPDLSAWIAAIDRTINAVRDDLLERYPARYPLFRMEVAGMASMS